MSQPVIETATAVTVVTCDCDFDSDSCESVTHQDLLSVSSLFELLAGVLRGGLSGRVVLGSIVFLVQL